METQFEYGSRRGMWRLLNLFEKHKIAITIYAVGKAYEQNPYAKLVPSAHLTAYFIFLIEGRLRGRARRAGTRLPRTAIAGSTIHLWTQRARSG